MISPVEIEVTHLPLGKYPAAADLSLPQVMLGSNPSTSLISAS
jgi:hypothetical protein